MVSIARWVEAVVGMVQIGWIQIVNGSHVPLVVMILGASSHAALTRDFAFLFVLHCWGEMIANANV